MRKILNTIALTAHRHIGQLFPKALRQRVYWLLNPPDHRRKIDLVFDIVGNCNLRCPSCPVGSVGDINPQGKMDLGLYKQILEKAKKDFVVQNLVLYNWGETLLHPQLPEFVRIGNAMKMPVLLSTNLNILNNAEEIFKSEPDMIRISLSGFTQPVYGLSHKNGNIEKVKENMRRLAAAKKQVGNTKTKVNVYFHKYRHNLHEVSLMKKFSEDLGFSFEATWAYLMPFEKVVEYMEGKVTFKEREFVENTIALPIRQAVEASTKFKDEPCALLENQVVLDLKGNLLLCCAVYDYDKNRLGSYLTLDAKDLDKVKANHPSCSTCANYGLHKYFLWQGHPQLSKQYETLVENNLQNPIQPEETDPTKKTISL